jgi:SWIM zinc finger
VVAVAPSPARFAAAEAIAVPSRWAALGADRRAAWGRCRGSGREPYDTMVDHSEVAWRCTCPSRSHPCKHALALLAMWVRGQVPDAAAPPTVSRWADGNAPRSASGESPAGAPASGGAAGEADDRPGSHDHRDRSRDERLARLVEGLVDLDRWLDDRIRTGLADPALARYATWDSLAARLVDARAGALANRVRRLAGAVGTKPEWHEHVLAELGVLHLLAQAGRRVRNLPAPLADAVATACGWQVRQADVLAGVPETDTWVVAGRSDTREDRIEVRRVWLHGASTGRWAMILSFAAYRQSLDDSLPVGTAMEADLHRYPGAGLRALVGSVHAVDALDRSCSPPSVTVAAACDAIGEALIAEPWSDHVPATVRGTVTRRAARWVLADETGSIPLAADASGLAVVLAASAGEPIDVTVEWTSDGAVPLTVHLDDRALDIGPRADPSFVSAA